MRKKHIERQHQVIRRRKMHCKVRQPVIALNGGYRSEPVLHILEHLREYPKIKRRGRQLVIPHCHCKCGEHKHKNGGQCKNRYPAFLCEFRKPYPVLSYSIPYSEGYKQDNSEKKSIFVPFSRNITTA